jgi:hypothetical protein
LRASFSTALLPYLASPSITAFTSVAITYFPRALLLLFLPRNFLMRSATAFKAPSISPWLGIGLAPLVATFAPDFLPSRCFIALLLFRFDFAMVFTFSYVKWLKCGSQTRAHESLVI